MVVLVKVDVPDPKKVLLNLLAQAEHDPSSKSFLLSTQSKILNNVRLSVPPNFLKQIEFVSENSEQRIIDRINEIAPEHLYLAIRSAQRVAKKIKNAGAIFLGQDSPVALGDYAAGPSHVLPTNRAARFSSGLSVKDFLKWNSLIQKVSKSTAKVFAAARTLAEVEGLQYHSQSLMS